MKYFSIIQNININSLWNWNTKFVCTVKTKVRKLTIEKINANKNRSKKITVKKINANKNKSKKITKRKY